MMCRLCGYELDNIKSNTCDSCGCCGKCGKQNEHMLKCPNCGHLNYIESDDNISIVKIIKEKLSI